MAMLRYGSAEIVEPSVSSEQWQKSVCCGHKASCTCGTKSCRVKVARTILAKYDPEKYLLSHASIIAAVDVDNAKESKSKHKDYLIKPEYSKYVNNNGDAWTKSLLAKTYKTFIGANNYLEHVQVESLSKGKVIDAVLREVTIGKDKEGKDITTYFVDILIATERKHKDLVAKIQSGEIDKMSMGCKIAYSLCTKCGNKAVDESEACEHVRYEKNNTFYHEDGTQRKVAELCLPWNVKILTSSGYKYIEEVQKDELVITHKGLKKRVIDIYQRPYVGELIRIKAEGMPRWIESTPEHPFYVYDGKKFIFKKAMELNLNDFLVSRGPVNVSVLKDMNIHRAKLLGLYVAEGCAYNGIVDFTLNPEDEQDLALQLTSLLEKEFPNELNDRHAKIKFENWKEQVLKNKIKPIRRTKYGAYQCPVCGATFEYLSFFKSGHVKCKVCNSCCNMNVEAFNRPHIYCYDRKYKQNYIGNRLIPKDGSKKFIVRYKNKSCYDFFKKYCSGNRAYNKKMHEDLLYAPLDIQKEILVYWLKGDGSIDPELRLRGYTTSENVFRTMEILANRLNFWNRSQVIFDDKLVDLGDLRIKEKNFDLLLDSKDSHTRFTLYFSPRDSEELCVASGFSEKFPKKRKETRKINNCILRKIRALDLKNGFNGNVFNLKIDEDNSFIVDGVITHNCGHFEDPDSVTFIDASWVKNPAFTGAEVRNVINPPEDVMVKIREAEAKEAYKTNAWDYLKAAKIKAQDKAPGNEDAVPPADEKAPPEDTGNPPEDTPDQEKLDDDSEDKGAPADEALPPAEEESPEDEVQTLKTQLKQQILKELGDQIMNEFSGEDNKGPRELETLEENLIQPTAALKSLWTSRKAWNQFLVRKAGYLDKKNFDKLRFGSYILLSSNDLGVLSNYGYSRRDFLAVMAFLDSFSKKPLDLAVKKAVAKMNGTRGRNAHVLVTELQKHSGKVLTSKEICRGLAWLQAMDSY